MVNCTMCHKAFRSRVGKSTKTRCESCANMWRQKQLLQEENERIKDCKETELRLMELTLRGKQIDLERQKVTIKETSANNGNVIELTCYYDHNSGSKIHELLSGARRALPTPPAEPSPRLPPRRRYLANYSADEEEMNAQQQRLLRRPRKLPSIEGLANNRMKQRFLLDEECSTSANSSGLSVD